MPDLSRKVLRDGIERLVSKGASRIEREGLDLGSIIESVAKGLRDADGGERGRASVRRVSAREFGETLFEIARSVDSLSDLGARLRAHRGEFSDAARAFSADLYEALRHLESRGIDRAGTVEPERFEIAVRGDDDNEELLGKTETGDASDPRG